MSRKITKPEEATPHEMWDDRHYCERYFTAAETAQIARRLRVLQDELDDPSKAPEAAKEIIEWEKLFLEWGQ